MLNVEDPMKTPHEAASRFMRAVLIGSVGLGAIAVWAINFEPVVNGDIVRAPFLTIFRIVICDAIPLAALVYIYRSIGKNEGIEDTLRGMLASMMRPIMGQAANRLIREEPTELI
ncbi:hypothetical protein Pan216_56030 [Planctomycetes bacterium Pan216]|uniref:Uncharacterized protein n=1 Tax=Kolteria novifilia TaxID=2527975 RepID=A0A518BCK3_9BACT|nr:hypothetical protein Pan216_56030 [Planctomycetes bacterium Pan216]